MLSRSSSNAGERLRRAKSTSSAHTNSFSHQRSSTSIDPFVIRQHAEVAALEAFQRAKQQEETACRSVPSKLQRRRSQATGKTQGSHFEDARLGRRRSASRKDENRRSKPERAQQLPSEPPTSEGSEGEVVITRKRSVIPPSSAPRYSLYDPSIVTSSSRNERRMSQATYCDGSPLPRHGAATQRSSAMCSPTGLSQRPLTNDGSTGGVSYQNRSKTQRNEDMMTIAQDHSPPRSQSKRLRERKSFILAPFQKRKATNNHRSSEHAYDTMLPPFNYADEGLPPSPLPPPADVGLMSAESKTKKSRTFSESFKGRFKKVFRKATRLPTAIPAQHVEATSLHYPFTTQLSTPMVQPEGQEDPFITASSGHASNLEVPGAAGSNSSRHSSGEQSAAKSRVTSWTNSTVAGTWSTCDALDQRDNADEQGRLKRSGSTSTLKKAKSFFGRPVRDRLRKTSKLDLQDSEESAGLYSALQDRIQPADSASQVATSDAETQSFRISSALDTLPSRQRADSTISSRGGWQFATIRSVTPDPTAYRLDVPSPVAEVLSPEEGRPRSRQDDTHEEQTPRSQLQRRPALKAPTPSKEQIERRIERCKNRWQSPLNELSPSALRPSKHTLEENSYELRSLSRTLHQTILNDLPHHARVGEPQPASIRPDVLSPSVYSRAMDGESPRPLTPAAPGGMVVTITGREVKSYTISPSKVEQPAERAIHASQKWRRWLSDEMNGWDGSSAPPDLPLPKGGLKGISPTSNAAGTIQRPPNDRHSSVSSSLEPPPAQIRNRDARPRPSSRLSSYMNDRYPMMDTGRNSSEQSVGRRSRISSGADSRPGTAGSTAKTTARQEKGPSAEGSSLKSALARQRVVKKPSSTAQLAAIASDTTIESENDSGQGVATTLAVSAAAKQQAASASTVAVKPANQSKRPKSAFDLRANYKSASTSTSRPLEVRRKADNAGTPNMLEDSTILNISAGPYAATSSQHIDKENVQPHPASEPSGLPALSSSEWLAAGTSKKREVQPLSAVHPACRNRTASRYSPSRSSNGTPTSGLNGGGGGSPGHRLATSWLDGKRSKENSPAFV